VVREPKTESRKFKLRLAETRSLAFCSTVIHFANKIEDEGGFSLPFLCRHVPFLFILSILSSPLGLALTD